MVTNTLSVSGIYQIVNLITQKRYIGYATNIRTRINGHLHELKYGNHPNDYLQKAWLKYGSNAFTFTILQECEKGQLCLLEDYWVKVLKTTDREFGYNLKETNPNGKVGLHPDTIEKIRQKNKGKKPSALCIQRRKEIETSNEGKQRQREGLKLVDWVELRKSKRKAVINTTTGEIFLSLRIAAETTGISKHKLSKYLSGTRTNKTTLKYL